MFNAIIKSFAVMAIGMFTFGFLVTTATLNTFATTVAQQSIITFEDKSTTKNLSVCVNNTFVTTPFSTKPGSTNVKAYYGNLSGATTCDVASIQKNKVFEITKDLTDGQTLQIVAEGTATLTGSKQTVKPVLLSTTDLPGILSQNTVSWKAIAGSSVKYKDAICMDEFLIKEDAIGSMKSKVIHSDVPRSFSFDFSRNGAFCTASDLSPKLDIDIHCGCEGAKLYEIGLETIIDNSNISYTGLIFTTKVINREVVPVLSPKPTPTPTPIPLKPVVPVPVIPTSPVVAIAPVKSIETAPSLASAPLAQAQTVTVRSGGSNIFVIVSIILTIGSLAYFATKTKKFQIS